MNVSNVISRFALVSGLENSELSRWSALIDDAIEYIESRVKIESPDEAQTKRLEMLSAVYAFRMYEMCNDNNITSFTAGDVKFTSSDGEKSRGQRLWDELAEGSSDIIDTGRFIFGRVQL